MTTKIQYNQTTFSAMFDSFCPFDEHAYTAVVPGLLTLMPRNFTKSSEKNAIVYLFIFRGKKSRNIKQRYKKET